MNRNAIETIVRKDIKAVTASVQMWLPMVIVPAIFVIGMPLILILVFSTQDISNMGNNLQYMERFMKILPAGSIKDEILSFQTLNQKMVYLMMNYFFAPMFLLLPVMVSSIISSNSFAGEKERKTMESLLFSPVKELELMLAKVLAAFIPAIVISLGGFLVYGLIVDTFGYSLFHKMVFPTSNWILMVVWLIPSITILSIFLSVLVSAKVKGYQEAQQISILILLPVIGLFIGQMTGVMFLSNTIIFIIGMVVFIIDAVLIKFSSKMFNRESLFMSQM